MQGNHRQQSSRQIGGGGFLVNVTSNLTAAILSAVSAMILTVMFTGSLGCGPHSPIAKGGRFGECPRRNPRGALGAADTRIGKIPRLARIHQYRTNALRPQTYKELGNLPL